MDSRGVSRGRCTSCNCPRYHRSDPGGRCATCSHAPAKHLNLDRSPLVGQSVAQQSADGGRPSQPYQATPQATVYTPPVVEQYSCYPGLDLKPCPAPGCHKKVHYDPELGPFDYCSPECRDRDLLPREREKLRRDIEANSSKMTTYLPSQRPTPSSSGTAASSVDIGSTHGKKRVMETIIKKPRVNLGIVTAKIRGEPGLRIVGIELNSPAQEALKEGKIKLLDIITELNEERISSREWFEQSTRDKTRPMLTLLRNNNTASGVKNLLSKVKDKCKSATHIRVAIHPAQIDDVKDFGIEPFKTTNAQGETTGYFPGVIEENSYSAHISGVTTRDEVLMYGTMNSKNITELRTPFSETLLKSDIQKAKGDSRHLVLVLKNYPMEFGSSI